MRYQFGAGFAVRIRIITVQFICFAVAPLPLIISVYLICRHVQERFYAPALSHCFQNVDRSHDICLIRINRIFVGFSHDRLCRQMQYDLWLCLCKNLMQFL